MALKKARPTSTVPSREEVPFLPFLRDWHVLGGLALLLAFFFREIIFQKAFFWEDFLYQFYPFRNFATVSLSRGEIPLWNPYTFMGMPFLADITGTVAYLPHLVLIPFVSAGKLPFWYVELYQIAHVYLAGITMFYCARSFGLARVEAGFASLAYMLSGFMTVHAIHLVVICQAAWFPLAVMLFRLALRDLSVSAAIACGGVMFLITCGGHPQITLYYFTFLGCYALYEIIPVLRPWKSRTIAVVIRDAGPRIGNAALVLFVAVGLSAVQLLPTMEMAGHSIREEMTYARSTEGELFWPQMLTLLIPKFFGSSTHLGVENPVMYWGPQSYWNFWETCLYVGITTLALAVAAVRSLRTHRAVAFLAGFAVFSLLCALGDNFIVHWFLYNFVPGFDKFRAPGRWGFFVAFSCALLSGFGLKALASAPRDKRLRTALLAIPAVTVLVSAAVQTGIVDPLIRTMLTGSSWRGAAPPHLLDMARTVAAQQSLTALAVACVSAAVLYMIWKNPRQTLLMVFVLPAVTFGDLYIFGFNHNNGATNPDAYFSQQRDLIAQLKREGEREFFRVNSRNSAGMLLDRNQGLIDNLFLTEGYTQLALKRRFPPAPTTEGTYRLLNTKYRLRTDTVYQQGRGRLRFSLARDSVYLPRAFFVTRYIVTTSPEEQSVLMSGPAFDPAQVAALEEPLSERIDSAESASGWTAAIRTYRNNAMTLEVVTPKKGLLVLSEIHFPGWNAYVDGVPTKVYRADWSLRALVVEQGTHMVELRYEPASFAVGSTITLLTAFGGAATVGVAFLRRQRSRRHTRSMNSSM